MYFVFDIGGTNMRFGVSRDGITIDQSVLYSTPAADFDAALAIFSEAATRLCGGEPITAIAGGIPGPMNEDKSAVVTAPNLPGWNNKPLTKMLQEKLSAPVFLENDTAMIALGEAAFGAGRGKNIVVYITVSTGVGGSRVVNGKIDSNAFGFEPGHQIVSSNGELCGCGGKGHLEALISGTAVERKFGKPAKLVKDRAVWDQAEKDLAIGLNNVLVFWSPDIILLGGSVMNDVRIEKVREHLQSIVTIYTTLPPLEPYTLGTNAGLLGALAYAHDQGI